MELTTDVLLRGTAWNKAIDGLSSIFRARPHYMLYMLSMSIGIMYDQRIQKPEENGEDVRSIPRNVFHKQLTHIDEFGIINRLCKNALYRVDTGSY